MLCALELAHRHPRSLRRASLKHARPLDSAVCMDDIQALVALGAEFQPARGGGGGAPLAFVAKTAAFALRFHCLCLALQRRRMCFLF